MSNLTEIASKELAQLLGLGSAVKTSILNVTSFGAKGDGFKDDTTAIQKALDCAGEIQASIYFPAGTYRITDSLMLNFSNKIIFGEGTILIDGLCDGFSLRLGALEAENIQIRDIHITSTNQQGMQHGGYVIIDFHSKCRDIVVDNVHLYDFNGWGVVFGDTANNIRVTNNRIYGSMATSVWVGYAGDNILIANNIIEGNYDHYIASATEDIYIDDRILVTAHNATFGKNVVITGNVCRYSNAHGVMAGGGREGTMISNNIVEFTGLGIEVNKQANYSIGPGKYAIVSNNIIRNTGRGGNTEYFCLKVKGCFNVKLQGNMCISDVNNLWDFTSGAIYITDDCDNVEVTDNHIYAECDTHPLGYGFATGVRIFMAKRVRVERNYFYNTTTAGIIVGEAAQYVSDLTLKDNVFRNVGRANESGFGVRVINLICDSPVYDDYANMVIQGNTIFDDRDPATLSGLLFYQNVNINHPRYIIREGSLLDMDFNSANALPIFIRVNRTEGGRKYAICQNDQLPDRLVWTDGDMLYSRFPSATNNIGYICTRTGGMYKEPWNAANTYIMHEHVLGSDGAVYEAIQDVPINQDPITVGSLYWNRIATQAATFKSMGYLDVFDRQPTLPVPSIAYQGRIVRIDGSDKVPDRVYYCKKLGNGAFDWVQIV